MPDGIRLYVTREYGPALDLPFRQTTELAAHLLRAFEAPACITVVVQCDPDDFWRGVVQACRARHCRFASTLKSPRLLFNASWQLNACRDGRNLFRRRRTSRPATAASRLAGGEYPGPAARRLLASRDCTADPRTRDGRFGTLAPWTVADG
jgi:hypothetical protein